MARTPKRTTPASQRLSTITEGQPAPTTQEQSNTSQLTNLPVARRLHYGDPPAWNLEKAPPGYTEDYDRTVVPPSLSEVGDEPSCFTSLKRNLSGRGGWKRLVLIGAVIIVIILAIALGAGLGVGLSQDDSGDKSSSEKPPAEQPFPAGKWTFNTFLDTVNTDCASDPSTWSCWGGDTYSDSPSMSAYAFNWEISRSGDGSYKVSNDVVFTLQIPPTPLKLHDKGTPDERYTFTIPHEIKSANLFMGGVATTCFYNDTTIDAVLYTKKKPTYSAPGSTKASTFPTDTSEIYEVWPGSMSISQTASGGTDVPNCYHTEGGDVVSGQLPMQTEGGDTMCECSWRNIDQGA